MPRFAISDYIFYKLACLDSSIDLRYVGSTANWKQRKRSHKSNCNNENGKKYNYKVYTLIRANGGWDNFKMIEIGKQEQITLREAEYIEEKYRVELNATMNDRRCFLTEEQKKELYENNKEQKQEYNKEWRENNPEHIKEYHKKYAQTETGKAKQALANKKYAQTETAKTKHAATQRNYRAKKKAELAVILPPQL
tara:strand:- start:336 stop:920 length:585 start_codon:yes stop_codon:yes gene_type:complete